MRRAPDDCPRPPLPLSDVSNGEWCPRPPTDKQMLVARLLGEEADRRAHRLGMTRAQFMRTAAGTLTAFWVLNRVHGLDGSGEAAVLPVTKTQCEDLGAADDFLRDSYFIVDVQTHHVDLTAFPSSAQSALCFLRFLETNLSCAERYQHLSQTNFVKEVFVDSQTDVAVLSGVPGGTILPVETMATTRDLANGLAGSQRALAQAMIDPAAPAGYQTALDTLEQQVANGAKAIKCYTGTSAPGGQWRLDDEQIAYPMFEKAQALGIDLVNVHKGLPGLGGTDPMYVATDDIPQALRDFPGLKLCVYHSGYFPNDLGYGQGIDGFIQMIEGLERKMRRNLYAEIGSTFAMTFLQSPTEAAHLLGRLLKALGSRNIFWGTDSIWWGSPQWQIDAFKTLEIPDSMRQQYGYPRLTKQAKRRILGLNAARRYGLKPRETRCAIRADQLSQVQLEQGGFRAGRSMRAYGPRTRREFLALLRSEERKATIA